MTNQEILNYLVDEIHTSVMASVDENGHPITSVIDMMITRDDKLYFITAKGKSFYKRIINNDNISLSAVKGEETLSSIAITVKGQVRDIGDDLLSEVFEKNPYMNEIYPNEESRKALTVLEIYRGDIEYFDLSKKPIERFHYAFGKEDDYKNPYEINSKCVACGACLRVCPMFCIKEGKPYVIEQKNCLHCGNCYSICKHGAVDKNI